MPETGGGVWSSRLAAEFSEAEESDRTLRRYYQGKTLQPQRASAYAMGWAFHAVGIRWCSGPVALQAAGHFAYFIRLLAFLSEMGERGRSCALRFAFATARANDRVYSFDEANGMQPSRVAGVDPKLRTWLDKRRTEHVSLGHQHLTRARTAIADNARERDLIENAWNMVREGRTLRGVAADFQLAVDLSESSKCQEPIRFDGLLTILARSAQGGRNREHADIVRDLITLSPSVILTMFADELMRNPEMLRRFGSARTESG